MKNYETSTTPESEKDLAQTPKWFIDSLTAFLGIESFELDVASLEATKKAGYCYSLAERGENSLELPWDLWNWCNPPFSNIAAFLEKAVEQASTGYRNTAVLIPNNPETQYVRYAKEWADTIIEMPFRLKFKKPNGMLFLDKKGKEQGPQFSCMVAVFTPLGLKRPAINIYHDFRVGYEQTEKQETSAAKKASEAWNL